MKLFSRKKAKGIFIHEEDFKKITEPLSKIKNTATLNRIAWELDEYSRVPNTLTPEERVDEMITIIKKGKK